MSAIEWRPIAGYEGYYEVSERGEVRSIPRVVPSGSMKVRIRGTMLRGGIDAAGYRRFVLNKHGITKTHKAHRLVAFAFIGDPCAGEEVCHNDGNSLNNDWRNLRWDTRKANMADRTKHGRTYRGGRPTLSAEQRAEAIRRRMAGESTATIGADLRIDRNTVQSLYRKETGTASDGLRLSCRNGHPLVGGNVHTEINGSRRCIICRRASYRAKHARDKARLAAATE